MGYILWYRYVNEMVASSLVLIYNARTMSKGCDLCLKSTVSGNRIQHKHSVGWRYKAPKTKRAFKPNLRTVEVEVDGIPTKLTVCMKCYKKLQKEVLK